MIRRDRSGERFVALFMLGVLLLLPPFLLIFNRPERILGIPALYLYLFAAWGGLIALAALIARNAGSEPTQAMPSDTVPSPDSNGTEARRA